MESHCAILPEPKPNPKSIPGVGPGRRQKGHEETEPPAYALQLSRAAHHLGNHTHVPGTRDALAVRPSDGFPLSHSSYKTTEAPPLNTPHRSLLGSPVLPSRKALPLILLACSSPSLLCPRRISNFSSAGAYLEGSLAVCTKHLKNLQIL